ncbi:MAG: ATP-dependent RNA helicase HrpA [Phycisphaerales bacterium]|nr:ATP-dependent RNA helicase HrpA [Phycisphaerales bacterium]
MTPQPSTALDQLIDECMINDRHRLMQRLRALSGRAEARRPRGRVAAARRAGDSIGALEADIRRSMDRVATRRAAVPRITYPPDLPVVQRRAEIAEAIRINQVVVLCGETGSGKTTQLPKICLELGRGITGAIGHTQPRRVAARTVAARIADELSVPLGKQVGYKIRFGDQTSENTLIKIMTDGILLAETPSDRFLSAYDTIIIDEAHERSLNIDFLLGYIKQLLPRRRDLKVIITSATIDPQRFSAHFDDAPIIEVSGRAYPVEVRYEPPAAEADEDEAPDLIDATVSAVDELIGRERGDILVFLSGEREIREAAKALRHQASRGVDVLPLYSRLSSAEQNRIFQPHQQRRIVLATNVAETSVTVPGISCVVDPGMARISRYSTRTKVQRLPIEAISQASAEQRKGRCGRVGPGVCVRLYSEQDFAARPEFTEPEILRTNLASVILQMKALRLGDVERFPFIERPTARMIRDGYHTLHELGAVDAHNELTELGRELARLPIDPRLGRMILQADREHCLAEVLIIAAALSIPDPRERPHDQQEKADAAHARFAHEDSDFLAFVNLWRAYHDEARRLSHSKARHWCRQNHVNFMRMREWHDIHTQLRELAIESRLRINTEPAEYDTVHRAVLSGLLSNIGLRTDGHEYTGAHGTKFFIFPGSGQFRKSPAWIMAAEIVETTRLYARCVARIQPQWIEALAEHLVKRHYSEPLWSEDTAQVTAAERVSLYGLDIASGRRVHYGPIEPKASRELFIHHALVEGEWRTQAPFFEHNRQLIAEVEKVESKVRKRDVLVDVHQRFAFYDQRLPADAYSGATFDKWWKEAQRSTPRLLHMTRDDLVQIERSAADFPDRMTLGELTLSLRYVHDPGAPDDGVTAIIPVEALHEIDAAPFTWLVPGMRLEKMTALIKSLPKGTRTAFLPAGDFARTCAESLHPDERTLEAALGEALHGLRGIPIKPSDFQMDKLDRHLLMNFRIVDRRGHIVGEGRDLEQLRRDLAGKVRSQLQSMSDQRYSRKGITTWDFGALAESIEIKRGGMTVTAYPAVVDEGSSVRLTILDTSAAALAASRLGIRRLYVIAAHDELAHQLKTMPQLNRLKLLYASLGPPKLLHEQIIETAAEQAFLGDREIPRSREQFEARLNDGWVRIGEAMFSICSLVEPILAARHEVHLRLDKSAPPTWKPIVDDLKTQLSELLPGEFLRITPLARLRHIPRYVAAMQRRLERLSGAGLARDAQHRQVIEVHRTRLAQAMARRDPSQATDPRLVEYRWLIEELRVSLFAQDLGTAEKVSPQRLDKLWEQMA